MFEAYQVKLIEKERQLELQLAIAIEQIPNNPGPASLATPRKNRGERVKPLRQLLHFMCDTTLAPTFAHFVPCSPALQFRTAA
jgi:hypothetical protein